MMILRVASALFCFAWISLVDALVQSRDEATQLDGTQAMLVDSHSGDLAAGSLENVAELRQKAAERLARGMIAFARGMVGTVDAIDSEADMYAANFAVADNFFAERMDQAQRGKELQVLEESMGQLLEETSKLWTMFENVTKRAVHNVVESLEIAVGPGLAGGLNETYKAATVSLDRFTTSLSAAAREVKGLGALESPLSDKKLQTLNESLTTGVTQFVDFKPQFQRIFQNLTDSIGKYAGPVLPAQEAGLVHAAFADVQGRAAPIPDKVLVTGQALLATTQSTLLRLGVPEKSAASRWIRITCLSGLFPIALLSAW